MRLYTSLEEAASEIGRDLSKAPKVEGSGVQGTQRVGSSTHEILGYSYELSVPTGLPHTDEVFDVGTKFNLMPFKTEHELRAWMIEETELRITWNPGVTSEKMHPLLKNYTPPAYTYGDRLRGMVKSIVQLLLVEPTSRRAFWPIFVPEDAAQAHGEYRIPCSLGYQFAIRTLKDKAYLHMIYYQRSCDFNKYWITDVALAFRIMNAIVEEAIQWTSDSEDRLEMGHLTHMLGSLHSFINTEVY